MAARVNLRTCLEEGKALGVHPGSIQRATALERDWGGLPALVAELPPPCQTFVQPSKDAHSPPELEEQEQLSILNVLLNTKSPLISSAATVLSQ